MQPKLSHAKKRAQVHLEILRAIRALKRADTDVRDKNSATMYLRAESALLILATSS